MFARSFHLGSAIVDLKKCTNNIACNLLELSLLKEKKT